MYLCDLPLATVSYFFSKQFDSISICTTDYHHDESIKNQVLLISKLHVHNSKGKYRLNKMDLLNDIKQ